MKLETTVTVLDKLYPPSLAKTPGF